MRHIATRARSVRNPNRPFTCTGLGDRIHQLTCAWVLAQDELVTLHVTGDQMTGGQFDNKPESWQEILALFPGGIVFQAHPNKGLDNATWTRLTGAEIWHYSDFPGAHEEKTGLDMAPLLREIPRLWAMPQDVELPDRFCTVQFDSNDRQRTVDLDRRQQILAACEREEITPVVIGGEAVDNRLRWSLKHIAYALSRAEFHAGADSAFFHMAQLYMPMSRIYLYIRDGGFLSHHALRAIANGANRLI